MSKKTLKSAPKAIERLQRRHQELEAALNEEQKRPAPNSDVVNTLKREKLKIKDEIASLMKKQAQAALRANPNLCLLPLDELERREKELQERLRKLGQSHGPTARVIAEATSELRAIERELARREEDIDPLEENTAFQKAA